MPARIARWKRVVAFVVVGCVNVFLWGLPLAMFLTGAVMWRERHALVEGGIASNAVVDGCKWEPMFARRTITGTGGSGYFSCHYIYSDPGAGGASRGYFQSPRDWRHGDVIPIRYHPMRPGVSATEQDLKHPRTVPVALMLLPAFYAGFHFYRWRRRAMGAGSPSH